MLDPAWIGHDIVSVKLYESSQKMQIKMLYTEWTNKIKPYINSRWDEVATEYAKDLKHSGGTRPSKNDPKYAIFGFTVKLMQLYLVYFRNICTYIYIYISIVDEIYSVLNIQRKVFRCFNHGIGSDILME